MAVSEDLTKVEYYGPAAVTLATVTVGHTTGDGIELTYEPLWGDVKVDKFGDSMVDRILIGEKASCKMILAQFDPEAIAQAIMDSTYNVAGNPELQVGSEVGASALAVAAALLVRPRALGATETHDVTIYKAYAASSFTVPLKYGEQFALAIEFEALIDSSKTDGNHLFGIGDQTV